jgi:oxygen-independent coproporphyrinogen-3 oxidase
MKQYEISNFARLGFESRHNLKYWTRQSYLGFGVDAHSMLPSSTLEVEAVRFASADSLEKYVADSPLQKTAVSAGAALEEMFFLGLRLNRGVDLNEVAQGCTPDELSSFRSIISELVSDGLLEHQHDRIRLTARGRLLSNEVFQRFLGPAAPTAKG